VTQLYPKALGSIFVASYDSQGYAGGIRPRLHTGYATQLLNDPLITSRHRQHRKHRSSVAVQWLPWKRARLRSRYLDRPFYDVIFRRCFSKI
jgi:hypothetical protein